MQQPEVGFHIMTFLAVVFVCLCVFVQESFVGFHAIYFSKFARKILGQGFLKYHSVGFHAGKFPCLEVGFHTLFFSRCLALRLTWFPYNILQIVFIQYPSGSFHTISSRWFSYLIFQVVSIQYPSGGFHTTSFRWFLMLSFRWFPYNSLQVVSYVIF